MPIRDPVQLSSHYTPRREAWAAGEALRDIILKMVNALGSEGVTQAKEVDVEGGSQRMLKLPHNCTHLTR